jgi:hypothetical protein
MHGRAGATAGRRLKRSGGAAPADRRRRADGRGGLSPRWRQRDRRGCRRAPTSSRRRRSADVARGTQTRSWNQWRWGAVVASRIAADGSRVAGEHPEPTPTRSAHDSRLRRRPERARLARQAAPASCLITGPASDDRIAEARFGPSRRPTTALAQRDRDGTAMSAALAFLVFCVAGATCSPVVRFFRYHYAIFYVHPPSRWWNYMCPTCAGALSAVSRSSQSLMWPLAPKPPWLASGRPSSWSYAPGCGSRTSGRRPVEHLEGSTKFVKYLTFWLVYRVVDWVRESAHASCSVTPQAA